ncbi:M23 family metallopeptidase [Sphingomonas sanguinis]|uniref:M23 family metallopeptidase n=1 Tax=Sphingomonas sp. LC-1 TaxID=3110957 RepID=UPI0021BA5245|nr:M23 family metallopeptidase [Sphingomonas sp. LC-1]MCT8000958.1 M23 family metallopeptidase [Sphingomonas sp. LC-1]
MFLASDDALLVSGGTAARPLKTAFPLAPTGRLAWWRQAMRGVDWVPDLGAQIGSRDWWRGLATCSTLCAATIAMAPGFHHRIPARAPAPLTGDAWKNARAQAITPLALGADSGRRMAAGDLVEHLAEAPERPSVDLSATMGSGDSLARVLQRAGVSRDQARAAADLVDQATEGEAIASGTRIALTLGRRPSRMVARPLEGMKLRARFDLAVTLTRTPQGLAMTRQPIAIDRTPLRLQGLVGASLYRSARAAGAPAKVVEAYIKALSSHVSVGRDVRRSDSFDLIIARERAATGETRLGQLLFAGLDHGGRKVQLARLADDDDGQWYDVNGQSERRGSMGMPVAGRITSSFGKRMHPILGFMRMHKGTDIGAPYGAPIHAIMDGVVQFAGRSGGYGNFIKLSHSGGVASGYGHMSRFAVRSGAHVKQGQVIGYVGSTGMSTGPHLHWEVWKNGVTVNPRTLNLSSVATLSGAKLRAFRREVQSLLAVQPGR